MMVTSSMPAIDEKVDLARRRLLSITAASCLLPLIPGCMTMPESRPHLELFSAMTRYNQVNMIGSIDAQGLPGISLASDMRCHSGALHPRIEDTVVMFSRRPGTHLYIVDSVEGKLQQCVNSPEGRHFYGHGCFSHDGKYLFTTENDYEAGVGVIGIWDGFNFTRLGEMSSAGIGPHDIHLLSDGKTLVVANGGIRTHPDLKRRKLNLHNMKPALVYLDAATGKLDRRITLANKSLSIRHLAVGGEDKIAIALQYEGPQTDHVPLLATQQGEQQIKTMRGPREVMLSMRQYTASICIHPQTGIIGVTCPRGNIVTFWQLGTGTWVKTLNIKDAGGIALDQYHKNFIITTGAGEIFQVNPINFKQDLLFADKTLRWDNHLITNSNPKLHNL